MPKGRMIANMSLSPEFYMMVEGMAREKKISKSELLRRAMKQYIVSEQRWQRISAWGRETAKAMGLVGEDDVDNIIEEYRSSQKREFN